MNVEEAVDTTQTSTETNGEQTLASQATEQAPETKESALNPQETSEPAEDTLSSDEKTDATESATADAAAEEITEGVDVSEFLDEPKKSGEQRRIDKLTAEKYQLKDDMAKMQSRLEALESKEKPSSGKQYTDAQLATALKTAMDEGDASLVMEVMNYKVQAAEKKLRTEYQKEQQEQVAQAKSQQAEWTRVVDSYGYLSAKDEPEVYAGSQAELNINNPNSLLRQIALALYTGQGTGTPEEQEELFKYYHKSGGQAQAVADALRMILKKRRGTTAEDKEKRSLKNRLTKERRKKSLTAGNTAIKAEKSKASRRPMTEKERLDDYINERKQTQADRLSVKI